jgi:ADP-heptose:LPS heptosyltransferase
MFDAVIAKAAHCTIECTARVVPLLRRSFPAATVTVRRDPPDSVLTAAGAFDYQTAALSLCRLLRTDFSEFPAHRGYLRPDPQRVEALRAKYRAMKPGALVIGISWDSSGRHGVHKRLPLQHWTPILAQENALFVSLQYGAQSDTPGLVVDHDIDPLQDLDAAAAQVAAMDLVITVSNTTAHLAGAMNVPVWTLLPKGTGCLWYWFMDRDDSPWYPAMRLFRQPERGQWTTVIADAARALVEFIAKRRV